MFSTAYTTISEPITSTQLDILSEEIKKKNIHSWHTLMANSVHHATNAAYRQQVKDTLKLMFKESREDEAMFVVNKEEYEIIFPKIATTLALFFEDDSEFLGIAAHFYRDARFDFHQYSKTIEYATQAATQGNCLGMTVLAYQYFFATESDGIEQDKEKALDLADKAMLKDAIHGGFCKAFLLFREGNLEVAQSILDTMTNVEESYMGSAVYTLYAELAMSKGQTQQAIEFLEKATALDQSAHAYYLLGRYYLYGYESVQPNIEQGIAYLENAFAKGSSYAGVNLGTYRAYSQEHQDLDKAHYYLEKAATYNNPSASYELARFYLSQEQFDASQKQEAIESLKKIKSAYYPAYVELAYEFLREKNIAKDTTTALAYLQEGIEKGYGYAAFYLGREYQEGTFSPDQTPNYQQALYYYEKGAELGTVEAIEMAGKYYRLGVGVEPNDEKTLMYIRRGIEEFNSDFSKIELALCLETGFGVERNYLKAFETYQSVSDKTDPYVNYKLGLYYRDGVLSESNEPNFEQSFHFFTLSANAGYPSAYYEIAKATLYGEGTERDIPKALDMLEQSLSNGIIDAAIDIALYYEANTPEREPLKAFEYMQKASDQQLPFALYKLGVYYYNGFGTEENTEEAKKYYQLAIENHYPYANIPVGNIEFWQETSDSREENAFPYYLKAAEYGYYNYGLGMCYKYGIGTERNKEKAFQALKQGQEQGDTLAQYHLATCYLDGEGTSKNPTQAFKLFEGISEYHHPSKYQLAKLYLEGKGTDKNATLAAQYLEEVALQDYAPAQYELGNLYLVGNGVDENMQTALEWFEKAAENGHQEAKRIVHAGQRKQKTTSN